LPSEVLEIVAKQLKEVQGIVEVRALSKHEVETVLSLEEEAERRVMMGLARGLNLGVREALKRSHVLAAITNMNFDWGSKPVVKMVMGEEVVGEEVRDPTLLEDFKKRGDIVFGSFVIYKDKVKEARKRRRDCYILLLPLELSRPIKVEGVIDLVVGSPSPPADHYIKKAFNNPRFFEAGYGTIVVGFNVTRT